MDDEKLFDGEWIVALCACGKFVGKVQTEENGHFVLEPAYEVFSTMVGMQTPQGGIVHIPHLQVLPFLMSTADVRLDVIFPDATLLFSGMSNFDRANWERMVRGAREIQTKDRAARSGIELASAVPKRH